MRVTGFRFMLLTRHSGSVRNKLNAFPVFLSDGYVSVALRTVEYITAQLPRPVKNPLESLTVYFLKGSHFFVLHIGCCSALPEQHSAVR